MQKAALFSILSFFLTISGILLLGLFNISPVKAQSVNITVSAVIDEHLSYERKDDILQISTNYSSGMTLIAPDLVFQTSKPSVEYIKFPGVFSIFPNF